jgi:ATP-dependent Clp protease ATP-binding subunit ClpB
VPDAARKLALRVTDAAKELIAEEGYDPAYGARSLKRAIQRLVQNPLALHVLEGEFDDGDTVIVDREPGGSGLVFRSGGAGAGASEAASRAQVAAA